MIAGRSRSSLVRVLALPILLFAAGCGGSAAPPPAASPAPGKTGSPSPTAGGTAADRLGTGYRYRFNMTAPPNDNNAITEREVYLYFWPDTTRLSFRLENRIGTPIKILWNDCRFTDINGRTFKTVHEGISYENRNQPQDYTEVFGLQRHHDWLAPVDLFEGPEAQQGGGMRLLFPTDASAASYVGKYFSADLALEIEAQPRTYHLVFRIESVLPPG